MSTPLGRPRRGNKGSQGHALTVFHLCNVPNHDLCHGDLDDLSPSHHGELLLLLDAALEAAELLLLAPVVEGSDKDNTDDRQEDGSTFNPASFGLTLILSSSCCSTTPCRDIRDQFRWGLSQEIKLAVTGQGEGMELLFQALPANGTWQSGGKGQIKRSVEKRKEINQQNLLILLIFFAEQPILGEPERNKWKEKAPILLCDRRAQSLT